MHDQHPRERWSGRGGARRLPSMEGRGVLRRLRLHGPHQGVQHQARPGPSDCLVRRHEVGRCACDQRDLHNPHSRMHARRRDVPGACRLPQDSRQWLQADSVHVWRPHLGALSGWQHARGVGAPLRNVRLWIVSGLCSLQHNSGRVRRTRVVGPRHGGAPGDGRQWHPAHELHRCLARQDVEQTGGVGAGGRGCPPGACFRRGCELRADV
mmetsp:Transcript_61375/g.171765  ORF Transcript_61375/g.171765 Transcript_61375/m.171765 type:complete len:210 (+) Transcript_61375:723-1352(+)